MNRMQGGTSEQRRRGARTLESTYRLVMVVMISLASAACLVSPASVLGQGAPVPSNPIPGVPASAAPAAPDPTASDLRTTPRPVATSAANAQTSIPKNNRQ